MTLEDILPRHHSGASDIEAVNKIYPAEGIVWSFSRNVPMTVFCCQLKCEYPQLVLRSIANHDGQPKRRESQGSDNLFSLNHVGDSLMRLQQSPSRQGQHRRLRKWPPNHSHLFKRAWGHSLPNEGTANAVEET